MLVRADDVALEIVADHPRQPRLGVERLERGGEVGVARLAEHGRLDVGGVLEPRDERARVEARAVRGLPPAVLVQAVQLGARLELVEGAVQVEVGEDAPGLLALVGPAEQDGVDVHADELQALEVVEDAGHRQREHALALEDARRDDAGRLELLVLDLDPHLAQLLGRSARAERVVVFVTKRIRCPSARKRRTAAAAPAIGAPETCRTPSTSRRIAAMDAESIRSEIAFRFSRSSGPGGQHAQKSSTRAEALFDVEESQALTEAEKKRVLAKLGPVVRAAAQDERSQLRNRELATERVIEQLREATKVRRKRTATKPTRPRRNDGSTRRSAAAGRSSCGARPRTRGSAVTDGGRQPPGPFSCTTVPLKSTWRQ